LKWTVKAVKRKVPGFVVIQSDASPLDTVAHLPIYCEENNYVYIWITPTKSLGELSGADPKEYVPALFVSESNDPKLKKRYDRIMSALKK